MRYSLEKIAKELGVSKSTVSLILNGHASENRISAELEQSVKEFCKKVNYVPNIHARRACAKFAKNIGLLINENLLSNGCNPFSDQNTSEITGGVIATAAKKGFRVTIQFYNQNTNESEIFGWLRDREIDGLIYYGHTFDESWHRRFIEEKRNVVGIGIEPKDDMATVNIDNRNTMHTLSKALIEKGRRKFLYMAGYRGCYVSEQRLLGLTSALAEHGIPFDSEQVLYANFSEEFAYHSMFHRPVNADAIVCANDDMAIGVIRALKDKNLRVPEDVSVTGADNIRISAYFSPAVTTIDNMNTELGRCAFDELINLIQGGRPQNRMISSKVILRQSA